MKFCKNLLINWNGLVTSNDLETTTTNLNATIMELDSTKTNIADLTIKLNGNKLKNKNYIL
jgi:hypothetical protein